MSKLASPEQVAEWRSWVGRKVWKKGGRPGTPAQPKPFKSGQKINTVKGVELNGYSGHLAFTFEEDDSRVECFRCSLAPTKEAP